MKTITITTTLAIVAAIISCKENSANHQPEVKVANSHDVHATKKLTVKVDNELDPVCKMETAEFLNDTAHYAGKVYGFCSAGCKKEFAKNPETYLKEK